MLFYDTPLNSITLIKIIDKDHLTIIRRTYRYKVCKVLTKIYRVTIFYPTKRQCRCAHLPPKNNE